MLFQSHRPGSVQNNKTEQQHDKGGSRDRRRENANTGRFDSAEQKVKTALCLFSELADWSLYIMSTALQRCNTNRANPLPMTMAETTTSRHLFTLIAWSLPVVFFPAARRVSASVAGFGDTLLPVVRRTRAPTRVPAAQPGRDPAILLRPRVRAQRQYRYRLLPGPTSPKTACASSCRVARRLAGFPYGKNASPAGMLQKRLQRAFPDRTVEVVLTAMSAVNSYTLLDFAGEIIDIEPDAVVIYAGHNEFVGVLGVGSSFGAGRSPAMTRLLLTLRDWRIYQLVEVRHCIAATGTAAAQRHAHGDGCARTQYSIALDPALFAHGVGQVSRQPGTAAGPLRAGRDSGVRRHAGQ